MRQLFDENMCVRRPCRRFQRLSARVRLSEKDVLLHRAVKQVRVLADDGELSANVVKTQVTQIMSAEPDDACGGIVGARQQLHDR